MKRFARWLLRPIIKWVCSEEINLGFGTCENGCEHKGAHVVFRFECAMGMEYIWSRSTDQVRKFAWDMIGVADQVDQGVS